MVSEGDLETQKAGTTEVQEDSSVYEGTYSLGDTIDRSTPQLYGTTSGIS